MDGDADRRSSGLTAAGRRARAGVTALVAVAGAWLLGACAKPSTGADWPGYGGANEDHYSPLTQIDANNVARLGLAWSHDIDVAPSSMTAPVAVDGILYFAAGQSVIHALDAATGRVLWRYDPEVWRVAGQKLRGAGGIRGIAYANGRIFTGTLDGRLLALDAKSGRLAWSVMTIGRDDERYISGAPWVFGDKVVIGHGGADFAAMRGYVTAYDQRSGAQRWRFHTVPGNPAAGFESPAMAMAAKTWTGEWWRYGGGGTVWNAMAYDPRFNRIYIGTGNGSPWNQKIRSPGGGDNLFLCSIVALDADTGAYVWHYQVNPGETWDYNAAMDIELADLTIGGKVRPVLLHAPKNGFFYVIDRETGKLISARNIVPVNWARGIDPASGRPLENPLARYPRGTVAAVYPSALGAHSVEAMAFNPRTGLAYVPVSDGGSVYTDPPGPLAQWRHAPGQQLSTGVSMPPVVKLRPMTSALLAWNPVTQRAAWRIPLASGRGGGGVATTAGNLVFEGTAAGRFEARAADTGKLLWSFDAQTGVRAQPITYLAGGKQYVTVIAGARYNRALGLPQEWDYRTQRWRVLTFMLDGRAKLPPATGRPQPLIVVDPRTIDPRRAAAGGAIFGPRCALCHGGPGTSGGAAPELARSSILTDLGAFRALLHTGIRPQGMPDFPELSDTETAALFDYIRAGAHAAATRRDATPRPAMERGL